LPCWQLENAKELFDSFDAQAEQKRVTGTQV
jgi:hypothetical protein